MKRVRAIETGYDNVIVRLPDDVFEMPDDAFAPWFVDVDAPAQPAKKKLGQESTATTLSGIQKEQAPNKDDLI